MSDPMEYKSGEEDGFNQNNLPVEDCLEISEVNPNSLIGKLEKFKVTKWVNQLGYGAYGDTVEEATRRADALHRGDQDEYLRRDQ
jgi:hypothetical protein